MAIAGSARSRRTLPSTHDIAERRRARITAEPPRLIPVTREGWQSFLASLSAEELTRYGQIAHDQYVRERRFVWAQALMLVLAVGSVFASSRGLILWGYSRTGVLALGLSALLGYWPYRGAKVRRLWWRHYRAVNDELERRKSAGG